MRLVLLLALATMLAAYAGYGLLHPDAPAEALAYTVCPFRSEPVVTLATRVAAEDSLPVRRHEDVHAEQCRRLGPWRYRVRNLTSGGRLLLEAPAYCAGARARIAQGQSLTRVRERLVDDATAAFAATEPDTNVVRHLRQSCPELWP